MSSKPEPLGYRCPDCGQKEINPRACHPTINGEISFGNIVLGTEMRLCNHCNMRGRMFIGVDHAAIDGDYDVKVIGFMKEVGGEKEFYILDVVKQINRKG